MAPRNLTHCFHLTTIIKFYVTMVRRYKVRTRFFVLALPDLAKPVKKIVLENLENQFVPDS